MFFLSLFSVNNSIEGFSCATLFISKSISFPLFDLSLLPLIILSIPIRFVPISLLKLGLLRFHQLFLNQLLGVFLTCLLLFEIWFDILFFRVRPAWNFVLSRQIYSFDNLLCMLIFPLFFKFVTFWAKFFFLDLILTRTKSWLWRMLIFRVIFINIVLG